jgi:rhamnosyltransferase
MILPAKNNICAVITSYNPDLGFSDRLNVVLNQVDKLIIIDNNSDSSTLALLNELSKNINIHIIYNLINLGVAGALNQGILRAMDNNYPWILMLDQDTLISDVLVKEICLILNKLNDIEHVAIIGPSYNFENRRCFFRTKAEEASSYQEVKSVITSGSLISLDIFEKIGPFRDDLFIDFVDTEYCLRARAKGYKVLKMRSVLMQHKIGSVTMHNLPWRITGTSNHSPLRRYYMMRNNIIVARKYFCKDPLWVVGSLITRLKSTILLVCFEKQRLIKLKYSALGFIDGLSGKLNRTIK